ncbi:MAG: DUF4412 domain-containing protein [Thermodesulfobacteriota bacterium]|nr:DUF4412 domain-containing protein [Thermodesulfobacteriota bacterium]
MPFKIQEKHAPYAAYLLIFTALLILASPAWAGKVSEFSADQVVLKNGKVQAKQKIYMAKNKMRMEMSGPNNGGRSIMIFRQDKMLSWTLMPQEKAYVETRLTKAEADSRFMGRSDVDVKIKDLGTETINGYKCRKQRIQTTTNVMGRKVTSSSIVWISDQFDLPLKTQSEDGTTTELKNIKKGRPASALFEVPSGYKKMDNFMGAFSRSRARSKGSARQESAPARDEAREPEQEQEEEGSLFKKIPGLFKKLNPFGGGEEE